MSNTTRVQQKSSITMSRELRGRLKEARVRNAKLAKEGKLPPPTKSWGKDSLESLKLALSSEKALCD
jgi:hypothetical protein